MPKSHPPLSKAAFARAVGLSPGRVSNLIVEGLPVRPDGKIDEAKARRWITDNLDAHRRVAAGKPGRPGSGSGTVTALRAEKMRREGALLELELQRKRGELVARQEVQRFLFGRARMERDAWTGWTARAAQMLASEAGGDPAIMFAALDRLVRAHLEELAATPVRITDDD